MINTVLSKQQKGFVYADNFDNYFVVTASGFSELILSNFSSFNLNDFLDFVSNNSDIPIYIHIYSALPEVTRLFNNDNRFNTKNRERVSMRVNTSENKFSGQSCLSNYQLSQIDGSNYEEANALKPGMIDNFWNSKEHFLQNGYGLLMTEDNDAVGICYSAAVSDNISEIDILTKEEYRGKGIADILTKEYVFLSKKLNITPNWDCFSDNLASLNTAKKNKFETIKTYQLLSIYNTQR